MGRMGLFPSTFRQGRLATIAAAASLLALAAAQPASALRPGEILVAATDPDGLVRVDPRTGKQRLFGGNSAPVNAGSMFFSAPRDVAISRAGRIYVVDNDAFGGTGGVIALDPRTGRQTKISANDQAINASSQHFVDPSGIAIMPSGLILVVDRNAVGVGAVIAVDPATGKQRILASNAQPVNASSQFFDDPRGGIVVDRLGRVLVGDNGAFKNGGVIAVNPRTGKQSKLSANDQPVNSSSQHFVIPVGVAQTASGGLLVADQEAFSDGGIVGVDPVSGKQRLVSANTQPVNSASGYFVDPFDVAVGLDGTIIVVDILAFSGCGGPGDGCGGLIGVNPRTGKQRILSNNEQPINASSGLFANPFGLAVVPPRCRGKAATIYGTPRSDKIRGSRGRDVIVGGGGPDGIRGLAGNDLICGGGAPDVIRGGKGRDLLLGQGRADALFGGPGPDLLIGGPGRDLLRGGPGRDRERQ